MRLIDYLDNEEELELENTRLMKLNRETLIVPCACLEPNFFCCEAKLFKLEENGPLGFFYNDRLGEKYNEASVWPYKKEDFVPVTNKNPIKTPEGTFVFGKQKLSIKLSSDSYDNLFTKLFEAEAEALKIKKEFNWPSFFVYSAVASESLLNLNLSYFVKGKDLYISKCEEKHLSALLPIRSLLTHLFAEELKPDRFLSPLENLLSDELNWRKENPKYKLTYTEDLDKAQNTENEIYFSLCEPKGKSINKKMSRISKKASKLKKKQADRLQEVYQLFAAKSIIRRNTKNNSKLDWLIQENEIYVDNYEFTRKNLCSYWIEKRKRKARFGKAFLALALVCGAFFALVKFCPEFSLLMKSFAARIAETFQA